MKKYWKLVILIVAIVSSFTVMYIQASSMTKEYPSFTIKKNAGNEKWIESLTIAGQLQNYMTLEQLTINEEGTNYWHDRPFLKQLRGAYQSIESEVLQSKYKHFMRGKATWGESLTDGDTYVAYVNVLNDRVKNKKFDISILDKETGETTSFKHLIPNLGDFHSIEVLHVQVIENNVVVITENGNYEGRNEVHSYTFEIEDQILSSDDIITTYMMNTEMGYHMVRIIPNSDTDNEKVIVRYQSFAQRNTPNELNDHEMVEQELLIYDLLDKSKQTIDEVEMIHSQSVIAYYKERLYFKRISDQGALSIATYNLDNREQNNDFIPISNMSEEAFIMNDTTLLFKVHDGRLYVITPYDMIEHQSNIIVGDIETGEIQFKGEIVPKERSKLGEFGTLYIEDFGWK